MDNNIEQIKQKYDTDAAFAAALNEAKSAEEAVKVLRNAGFRLTEEELNVMSKTDGAALSDAELDKTAGGLDDGKFGRYYPFWLNGT